MPEERAARSGGTFPKVAVFLCAGLLGWALCWGATSAGPLSSPSPGEPATPNSPRPRPTRSPRPWPSPSHVPSPLPLPGLSPAPSPSPPSPLPSPSHRPSPAIETAPAMSRPPASPAPKRYRPLPRSSPALPVLTPSPSPAASPSPSPAASPSPSPAASPSPSPSPSANPEASPSPSHAPPTRLGRCYTGDEAGFARTVFHTFEPGVFFYAFPGAGKASGNLWVIVQDEHEKQIARLGGAYTPTTGGDPAPFDLPRHCQGQGAYGVPMAALKPGRYQALVFLNGRVTSRLDFTVRRLRGRGRVRVVAAQVEDAEGNRRRSFRGPDRGVYARIGLVNLNREQGHEHVLQVVWVGPQGQVGRPQGGLLQVAQGALLDGHDFPGECDPLRQDGIRIQGTSLVRAPGRYCARVYLDGRLAVEIPFDLLP